MMATAFQQHSGSLAADLEQPHLRAAEALDVPGRGALDAVGWLSAHLAAVDYAVHPAMRRAVPRARALLREQRQADHRLHDALWLLDRRLTGDVHTARLPIDTILDTIRTALAEHGAAEHNLVAALADVLSAEQQQQLADRLAAAMMRAPTRPHPLTPHAGMPGSLAFRIDALVDQIREGLDSRTVPTPRRVAAPHPAGRWGMYLLGKWTPAPPLPPADGSAPHGRPPGLPR